MEVGRQRITANDCQSLGVATETILEQMRKFRFTVRDILFRGLQLLNHVRQYTQRRVDVFRFFQQGTLVVVLLRLRMKTHARSDLLVPYTKHT